MNSLTGLQRSFECFWFNDVYNPGDEIRARVMLRKLYREEVARNGTKPASLHWQICASRVSEESRDA